MFRRCLILWLVFSQAVLAGPAEAVVLCAADLSKQEPRDRIYCRYLWLNATTAEGKATEARILSGWLNATSLSPAITIPETVVGNGEAVLRVRIDGYRHSEAVWDKLADDEHLFHARLIEQWPGGFDPRFGKEFKAGRYVINAHAPWLADNAVQYAAIAYLASETHSRVPIVDGAYFAWETGIQAKRGLGYYGLIGVKNRNDYFKLAGFHLEDLALRPETLAVISPSRISQEPRRIGRFPTDGGLWRTFDSEQAINDHNPLTFFDKGFRFDAEEDFAKLPNGFWAFGLFKENGDRQDSAPDFIGYHHQARSNDGRIHAGYTCISCHDAQPGNGGLQGIDDFVRSVNANPKFKPYPKLQADIDALRDKYGPNIQRRLEDDRGGYVRSLKEACDLEPQQFARGITELFQEYDQSVTLEVAAQRMGTTPAKLKAAIEEYSVNPLTREYQDLEIAGLASGRSIGVNQFHELTNLLHLELRGLAVWSEETKRRALKP